MIILIACLRSARIRSRDCDRRSTSRIEQRVTGDICFYVDAPGPRGRGRARAWLTCAPSYLRPGIEHRKSMAYARGHLCACVCACVCAHRPKVISLVGQARARARAYVVGQRAAARQRKLEPRRSSSRQCAHSRTRRLARQAADEHAPGASKSLRAATRLDLNAMQ